MEPVLIGFSVCYVHLNVALKREASVLPTLYNCGFLYVLWVTNDVTQGDLCDLLENW